MTLVVLIVLFFGLPSMTLSPGDDSPSVPAPTKSDGRARLAMTSMQPLTVAGRGFKPGEMIRITGDVTKRVRASRAGIFTVRFPVAQRCGLSIVAIGSRGSRAGLNFSQLLCAAP